MTDLYSCELKRKADLTKKAAYEAACPRMRRIWLSHFYKLITLDLRRQWDSKN